MIKQIKEINNIEENKSALGNELNASFDQIENKCNDKE